MFRNNRKILKYAFSILVLIGAGWLLWSNSTVKLNANDCAVVLRFGETTTVLNHPGNYYIIPIIDSFKLMPKTHSIDFPPLTGKTRTVTVSVVDPQQFYLKANGDHEMLERLLSGILQDHQRSGGTLYSFIQQFNNGDFMDSGVRLEID